MSFREWIVWAEPWAYGELQLKPWEFWRLTPREFVTMVDGFFRREDRDWERIGKLGEWLLWPHQGPHAVPMTVYKLIGRPLRTWPSRQEDDA